VKGRDTSFILPILIGYWALLLLAMMVVSIQIFSLPMEMRGSILFD